MTRQSLIRAVTRLRVSGHGGSPLPVYRLQSGCEMVTADRDRILDSPGTVPLQGNQREQRAAGVSALPKYGLSPAASGRLRHAGVFIKANPR